MEWKLVAGLIFVALVYEYRLRKMQKRLDSVQRKHESLEQNQKAITNAFKKALAKLT